MYLIFLDSDFKLATYEKELPREEVVWVGESGGEGGKKKQRVGKRLLQRVISYIRFFFWLIKPNAHNPSSY